MLCFSVVDLLKGAVGDLMLMLVYGLYYRHRYCHFHIATAAGAPLPGIPWSRRPSDSHTPKPAKGEWEAASRKFGDPL